jgi:hypothetical protein
MRAKCENCRGLATLSRMSAVCVDVRRVGVSLAVRGSERWRAPR